MDLNKVVAFFREKLSEFYTLPSRIANLRRRVQRLRDVAEKKGAVQSVAKLVEVENNLGRLQANHASVQSKLAGIFAKLGEYGISIGGGGGTLGNPVVVPLAVVAAASAVAIAVAAILADYAKQEKLLKQIEAGLLTPEEAKALGAGRPLLGIDLGKMALPIALAIGAAVLIPRLARG